VQPTPLKHPFTRSAPKWSPDGSKLLVETGRQPTVVSKDLKEETVIGPTDKWVTKSDWSPDGSRISYAFRDVHPGQKEPHFAIYSCNPDGTDHKMLSATGWKGVWSPDGEKIAYHLVKKEAPFRLAVMDKDGSNETVLSTEPDMGDLSWSPDSNKILYEVWNPNEADIVRFDLTTGRKEPILGSPVHSDKTPRFSPDGKTLLFERYHPEGKRTEIRSLDTQTGENSSFLSLKQSNHDAAWSPDGEHVVFSAGSLDNGFDLYVADSTGKSITQLTDWPGYEHAPAWSPDGKSIAFYHYQKEAPPSERTSLQTVDFKPL